MLRRTFTMMAGAALVATAFIGAAPASAQGKKIVLAVPGIPPIYSVTIAFVAQKQGFFKKYGADVEIKPFDNGTAAARAVVAGDIDLAWSPTPPVINQVSNAGVPLVAIYGMPNPDWVLGTTEAGKTCKDLAGQEIGVDSINGARSVALRSMLAAGCKDVKIDQVKQVALGSSPGPATTMRNVTFYQRDAKGMIQRELRSDSATWANPGWRLAAPTMFDLRSAQASRSAAPVVVARGLTLDQVALGKVSADAQPLAQLSRSIKALEKEGRRTSELKGKWWHKLSGPLSAFLMPLLGAVAGFGLARSGFLLARAVIGMALGFAYFVVDNAALAMGSFGGYPPLLAAWAPFLLFLLVGETVLIRTEE